MTPGEDFQHYNDRTSEEEKHTIWQIHKEILSHKPGEAVTSKLFQKTVLPNFRFAMFTAYRQLEDEKTGCSSSRSPQVFQARKPER